MEILEMTPYDQRAWAEVERWRDARLRAQARHLVPEAVRYRASDIAATVRNKVDDIPGGEQFVETFKGALDGLLAVRRSTVVKSYAKKGFVVDALEQIRDLVRARSPDYPLMFTYADMSTFCATLPRTILVS